MELDRRTATLRELNQHLEQRELERTADLVQMMVLLNEEMQARQQGEQHLIQALRAARAGVWEWDAATGQTIWSDDSYRILGLTPGSVEARYENWLRCVHPDDRAEVKRQVAQTMARGEDLNIEFRVVWPGGEIHWLNGVGQWQYDLAGQPIGMIGIQIDITERKRAENALRETMALLEQEMQVRRDQEAQLIRAQKLEVVGRLTGGIAHDFNNLLTVIKGNLEILREQGPDRTDPDRALLVEDALSATRQGAELTAGLLAFSRQQPLRLQRTRVNRIVEGLERLLDRVLGPAVVLRVETDPALPDVRSDPGQLQAALMNLMLNAQDAMPEGGTLAVRTAIVDVRSGTAPPVADLNPGRYVVVTVADSGIGMDADTLARACEPFFTTKPFGKGTGLGLSTVYGFAAQSHGGLAIESQPGQGATVRLFLPAMEPPSERTAREMRALPPPPLVPAGGTETILVVEDNARVRRLACRYLRDLGYTVLEAADADEAIAILETEPDIQMVFSDILMPGDLDGFDLAYWIAAHRPTVKRLLATGHHDERTRAVCADDPASPPVLAKPYSREQLAHQLRQLLDGEAGTSVRSLP
jgi:PAS domain S-box-containing protein